MGLICLLVVLLGYTIWDNNRITIVEQEIIIDDLPEDLEGFKILQVTDLHEKEFGKNQQRLIEAINTIEYQLIVFTGDMLDSSDSNNYKPIYSLIDGIQRKENALFIPGNTDPEIYNGSSANPFEKNDFINGMENRGVSYLESIYTIKAGTSSINFVPFDLSTQISPVGTGGIVKIPTSKNATNKQIVEHQSKLIEKLDILDELNDRDVLVALNHYPVVDAHIDTILNNPHYLKFRNYDLIIAGHYHGGQIRLPFIGALFVPEPWYENNGLFPPQDRVKGLWEYKNTKQYVSAGLGSSDAISFLKFRLFNPPEINVLTLTKTKMKK
jgi:uncharacterized protein